MSQTEKNNNITPEHFVKYKTKDYMICINYNVGCNRVYNNNDIDFFVTKIF